MKQAEAPARRPLLGILTVLVGLLLVFSILSSPPWPHASPWFGLPRDACGSVGALAANMLLDGLGVPLACWVCLAFLALGARALFRHPMRPWGFLLWALPTAFALSLWGGVTGQEALWGGLGNGAAGALLSPHALGPVGALLLAGGLLLVFLLLGFTRWLPAGLRRVLLAAASFAGRGLLRLLALPFVKLAQLFRRRPRQPKPPKQQEKEPVIAMAPPKPAESARNRGLVLPPALEAEAAAELQGPAISEPPGKTAGKAGGSAAGGKKGKDAGAKKPAPAVPAADGEQDYVLPPVALLEPGTAPQPINREELLETSRTLVRTLKDFGIQGQVGQVHPGPVVTQYEYEPAAGVRVAQIVSRTEDLALALKASRIRLVAPIPGKAAVGVEVPNRSPSSINLRSLLDEIDLEALPGELPMVLGRDIRGRPCTAQLEQMPHLLVAGTTGSGKSVFLNCVLLSLLARKTANDLRLLLIDPKMLELTPYDEIPHLVCPVVTEAKIAARMLGWLVTEMERRYRHLASVGVRNLEAYRQRARSPKGIAEGLESMPHIVVFVDELADLMLTLANEIEGPIARLAQMARAVGIHLVLATQRPSVDVITGVIKANFPSRIAFQVASKVDSRTILDANGAESLLGKGDMLFLPPGKAEPIRVHGAYVSERDTEAVVGFLRCQPPSQPLVRLDQIHREDSDAEPNDELFENALRLVINQKQASTSFLQRRLKVGYSRAGRLMDLLEQAGAVGPPDGSKPREVLADERFLEAWRRRESKNAAPSVG